MKQIASPGTVNTGRVVDMSLADVVSAPTRLCRRVQHGPHHASGWFSKWNPLQEFPRLSGDDFVSALFAGTSAKPSVFGVDMRYPILSYSIHQPTCPVDALPESLRQAVLYAIVGKGVPPAIALMDALAAAAAVVHVGHDCVTPDGDIMASSLYTLTSAPSTAGKGTSYRIFFKTLTQAMKRGLTERVKPQPAMPARGKTANLGTTLNGCGAASRLTPGVEALLTEMTYFALLKALNGVGRNVAIQDEDSASFFDSDLFKHHHNRLTQAWSANVPLTRAFGNSQLEAVDARVSLGLRTQPDILTDIPQSTLRKAIKIGLFPRFLVACHDPIRFPLNETYCADAASEVSDGAFQARMAALAMQTNARNFNGFASRVGVELDIEAKAFMHELSWRAKGGLGSYYADIREAAGRAWENTLRVAVVLHVFCIGQGKISRDYVERAWAIVEWSLSQYRLVFVESLRVTNETSKLVQAPPVRPIRVAPPKPPKLPRPLEDAQWLLNCLSRLWLPTKAVTNRELNLLAGLPARRLASALKWLELEGLVRLTSHGQDTLIVPLGQPFHAISLQG